jgi:hypothetical protein
MIVMMTARWRFMPIMGPVGTLCFPSFVLLRVGGCKGKKARGADPRTCMYETRKEGRGGQGRSKRRHIDGGGMEEEGRGRRLTA